MTATPQRLPDWFDTFWEANKLRLPVWARNDSAKQLARTMLDQSLQIAAKQAATPDGVRAIIAFAKISAIMKGVTGVMDAPNPSPDDVAEAVRKLVERLRP